MKNIEHLVVARHPVVYTHPVVYSPSPVIYSRPGGVVYYDNYHRYSIIGFIVLFFVILIICGFFFVPVYYV
jgi:hypothetical protein